MHIVNECTGVVECKMVVKRVEMLKDVKYARAC